MVIGLAQGRRTPEDDRETAYGAADRFLERFTEIKGTAMCRELTEANFKTPEGQAAFYDRIQEETCIPLLRRAVEILNEIFKEIETSPGK